MSIIKQYKYEIHIGLKNNESFSIVVYSLENPHKFKLSCQKNLLSKDTFVWLKSIYHMDYLFKKDEIVYLIIEEVKPNENAK